MNPPANRNGILPPPMHRPRSGPLMVALALILLTACAPAPVRLRDAAPSAGGFPLAGHYEARVTAPFAGTFTGRIVAEPTRTGFRANTRPGAAWPLIGGVQGFLGPIFMPYLFPSGVILSWTSTLPDGESPGEGWLGPGGVNQYGVRTLMDSPTSPVRLVLPDGRPIAVMTLRPIQPEDPHTDFDKVAMRLEEAMRTRLVPIPGVKTSGGLEDYFAHVHRAARLSRDDVEFAFGVMMAARRHLKFYPVAIRDIDPAAAPLLADWPEADRSTATVAYDEASGIATIKFEVFLSAADVDRAMNRALAHFPRALIIDLRTCPGVELASLRLLAWLATSPIEAGTFRGLGGPDAAVTLTLDTPADFDAAGPTLDAAGAVRLSITPVAANFTGPVAILAGRRTGSSAEALVSLAKDAGLATVVGEPTAGRVILSRPVALGEGWILRLPAAAWIKPDGSVVSPKGVEPDIRSTPSAASKRAVEALSDPLNPPAASSAIEMQVHDPDIENAPELLPDPSHDPDRAEAQP